MAAFWSACEGRSLCRSLGQVLGQPSQGPQPVCGTPGAGHLQSRFQCSLEDAFEVPGSPRCRGLGNAGAVPGPADCFQDPLLPPGCAVQAARGPAWAGNPRTANLRAHTCATPVLSLADWASSSGQLRGTHTPCPVVNPWVIKPTWDLGCVPSSRFHKGRVSHLGEGLSSAPGLNPPPLGLDRVPVPSPAVRPESPSE